MTINFFFVNTYCIDITVSNYQSFNFFFFDCSSVFQNRRNSLVSRETTICITVFLPKTYFGNIKSIFNDVYYIFVNIFYVKLQQINMIFYLTMKSVGRRIFCPWWIDIETFLELQSKFKVHFSILFIITKICFAD